ncbi:hypothetical protein P7K49_023104 [Saguinus oedipus]|uniref:Uncharacterized protein n=1 Tax=Saguinus oedipus TaxID=9490 RepID=A0ABQ9UKN8_SAGOE|nr:hypothetical protein P7K49_023104 [Saguinus oedipus]
MYRASRLVAIPNTPRSSKSNCRKSLVFYFRSVQICRETEEKVVAGGCGGVGSGFGLGSRSAAPPFPSASGQTPVVAVGKPLGIR